ncbi:GntR family transcriptional regulator [Pseudophaeobacter arcticus]|jgi:DNA-binding GntR family transcriptional regulator|uniref:GntR family transcriptional regulator n=1 Tax=Pseudophaeobacter arcticus TaxID=385492 RepID=UPI000414ACED|nr:GntR family transcriptional regulator [Pseudophaeobacter arcticus]
MSSIEPGSLRQSTYESIRALIVTGHLSPGERVTEMELVNQLGVSRTPVREALNRLQRDGLVVERPRSGFAVVRFDETMLGEAFDLRAELDAYATRLAVARITAEEVQMLRQLLSDCDALAQTDHSPRGRMSEMEMGIDFHRAIARFSGNGLLADAIDLLLIKCQVFVWMELTQLDEWKTAREDHWAIFDAIAAGDVDQACQQSRRHIEQSRDGILRVLRLRSDLRDSYLKHE